MLRAPFAYNLCGTALVSSSLLSSHPPSPFPPRRPPPIMPPDHRILNAAKRSEVHRKTKRAKSQAKLARRMATRKAEREGLEGAALRAERLGKNVPRTLDNTREYDGTSYLTADPRSVESLRARRRIEGAQKRRVEKESSGESEDEDMEGSEEEEVPVAGPSRSNGKAKASNLIPTGAPEEDEDEDEEDEPADPATTAESESTSAPTFTGPYPDPPKILITTSPRSTAVTHRFVEELSNVFPGGEVRRRPRGKGFELGRIARWAAKEERGYDVVLVVNEDHKTPSGWRGGREGTGLMRGTDAITVINLPAGPTAYFKLTSVQLSKEIHVSYIASRHYGRKANALSLQGHARPSPHSRASHRYEILRLALTSFPQPS